MIWLLWIVGALFALIAVVVVIGMMLPQNHQASVSAHFTQPPETIFGTIASWRGFPTWRSGLKSVTERQGEGGRESWIEDTSQGRMPLEVIEIDPPRRLVAKIADPKLPFGGTWTWVIVPTGDGCTLTITEDGEIYNPVFRLMARFVFGYGGTMKRILGDLQQKFAESGPARVRSGPA
ncbi:MAG: SRPBCC family protein [Anaerolineae bacterium]|nr:SRPBCC family protein [Phycisphaerae bacterium]